MAGFNSAEYAWKDITATLGGRIVYGITGVSYTTKIEREYLYAKGNKPYAIQDKNISYDGEIKILQSELEALIRSSSTKSLLDITLENITISYVPTTGSATVVTDQLVMVKFTEMKKEINQGDAMMEVSLPIMFLDLKLNI